MLNKGEESVMPQLDVGFHGKRKKKKATKQTTSNLLRDLLF